MKKTILTLVVASFVAITSAFAPVADKYISKKGHASFFSHTVVEDITANNYQVVSTIEPATGKVVFSVAMQAFEFENATMQKHFNSGKFLGTKEFPKAKFVGTITNLSDVNFGMDGAYEANVEGELELHGVTKSITEKGTITVKGDLVKIETNLTVTLADFNIAFEKGKPSTNIAKTIDIVIEAEHSPAK